MNWKKEALEIKKMNPKHILFLCVANSARSQMAEGIARSLAPSSTKISSAGSTPSKVNPLAIEVLSEIDIDIRSHVSKGTEVIDSQSVEVVITLCAEEVCPIFLSKAKKYHWGMPDPHDLDSFRKIRDELKERFIYLFQGLKSVHNDLIRTKVRENYALVATNASGCGCGPSCCTPNSTDVKKRSMDLGYTKNDVDAVPVGSNMGLGCGNPKVFADLKKGEVVLDLGSGGGFDSFLAAKEVGKEGRVIGVDMTPEMISKARQNGNNNNFHNVEFRLGEIEHLPVENESIDVIISNCVINLSPDKKQVFKDAFRVLKAGGRLAISDVVKTAELPSELSEQMAAYTGCVSGASTVQDIEKILQEVGFEAIRLTPKDESKDFIKNWIPGSKAEDYVQSAIIEARKPIQTRKILG